MQKNVKLMRPAWAEIDTKKLAANFRAIKQHVGADAQLAAVVKADGYGHGMLEVSRLLLKEGADWLAVATIPEGVMLRQIGIGAPILVLGLAPAELFPYAIEEELTLPISSLQQAEALAEEARKYAKEEKRKGSSNPRPIPFFLVVDTGMSRIGLNAGVNFGKPDSRGEEAFREACAILRLKELKCAGIFSHLADADDPSEAGKTYTGKQIAAFDAFVSRLRAEGLDPGILSIANSGAILDYPEATHGLCRPGIILYGYHPAGKDGKSPIPLSPVMTVKARLTFVKTVPAGTAVGYGSTFVAPRETVVGTVPVGYADGYPRLLSNRGAVLINGRKAPIIGNVCMDQFMVDLTDIPDAKEGDEVVLIGTSGDLSVTADDIGTLAETISWEILCGLGQRLERVYL